MTALSIVDPAPAPPGIHPPPADAPISTERLTKHFGKRPALTDVSLHVPRGATYGLIGLNGAGKSTTIRLLMGLIPPTSGRAFLSGVDVSLDPLKAKQGVGYVPDRCIVHPWMRVREAIDFCRGLQHQWNDAYCQDLIKRFRLDTSQRVGKLSKGTAAKLSLLLALAHNPDVLILDEPTDGLDPVARDDFLEGVLASACERDRTILMSSHSLGDLQRMADYIGLIHEGRLMIQCPTEDLVRKTKRLRLVVPTGSPAPTPPPGTIFTRRDGREHVITLRDADPDAIDRLRAAAGATHVDVEDMTLDDIFKDFVRGQEKQP